MNITDEILQAKGKQWAKLVAKRADKLAKNLNCDKAIIYKNRKEKE